MSTTQIYNPYEVIQREASAAHGAVFHEVLGEGNWEMEYQSFPDMGPSYLGRWTLRTGNRHVAEFTLNSMPGTWEVVISSGAYVNYDYRGKGFGTALNLIRQYMARKMGYKVMMCTDNLDNEPQRKILAKTGWQDIYTFDGNVGGQVAISVVKL